MVEELLKMIPNNFEVLEKSLYKEMENDDSIYLVLKKKD